MKWLRNPVFWLFIILVLATWLRIYKISDYLLFLGDQGRDVLVVKRMIVDHRLTLLGPAASVGGFFTGPLYYYFMVPFLWLWQMDPVGPAYLSVFFGLATVVLVYLFCSYYRGHRTGLIAAFLVAISPKMVEISRFSWNPNPGPFFALLTIFLLCKAASGLKRSLYIFLASISLGTLAQLHYINLIFLPIYAVVVFVLIPKKEIPKQSAITTFGFLLANIFFLAFEFRHGFPNILSVWEFITRGGQTVAPRSLNFLSLAVDMSRRLYVMTLSVQGAFLWVVLVGSLGYLLFWCVSGIKNNKERPKSLPLLIWLVVGIFGVGSYRGQLFDHYFTYLYPIPFIALGFLGSSLLARKFGRPLFVILMSGLIYLAMVHLYFWQRPNNMVEQIKEIDKTVLVYAEERPYNLALISTYNSDFAYRYFLEIWGKPPVTIENPQVDPERRSVTPVLVVICESKKCEPLGHSLWEIAGFGRAEISMQALGPGGIRVFKLVHYTGK